MYENLFTENFYCAKVSVATCVMALYKYFKPILPDPNGELSQFSKILKVKSPCTKNPLIVRMRLF